MNRTRWICCTAALWLAVPPSLAAAQDAAAQETAPIEGVDPLASEALTRMATHLRALTRFGVTATGFDEEVFTGGEKLQFPQRVVYRVDGANKLFADIRSDRKWRRLYFDGTKATIVAPPSGYYTEFPASGTTRDLLAKASDEYGYDLPLQDLFLWAASGTSDVTLTAAFPVGPSTILGKATTQYFYRADGVDFQLWIGDETPLPYRIVITNTEDPAQPQFAVNLEWDASPTFETDQFAFTPGPNNSPIKITTVLAANAAGQ